MAAERLHTGTEAPAATSARVGVQIDGVTKKFGAFTALHEAWLKIEQGSFMTLLGPSGCGKTTLLNLLAGFLEANGGEIFVDGQLMTETPPYAREIGVVFQNYALFPHMSVEKNVGYGLAARGVPKREIASRVADMLALVKLSDFGHRKPKELSGGQQQRVALARALVIRPKLLLLDEPFSALDKNLRGAMQVEIKEIQRSLGVTTIFVTHDQSEALSMSDRIAVMSAGRIRQVGTPDEIYRRPTDRFVASFVGDVNVLPAKLERRLDDRASVMVGAVRVEVPAGTVDGLAPGAAVDLFVRPDALAIGEKGSGFPGTIAAHVYQGSHVDVLVDSPATTGGRLLVRVPGTQAPHRWPVGQAVGVTPTGDAVAFPPEAA
ncbi:spermidine/putrescine import ATP-binding protein PotA [Azorhizobium oxalatiphilum]|uniref:Spermidine/putrescine import ATP-binding protein PotA n=1 Tax=Azorhizobium oxalatiphilum TaxID=980631 RepID=A0A917FCT9_9HYPH|nr:ABC transporter ATP-binding protein [Azorhizobium oxalatiphilum]GGF67039.1 spermidine/putrescine import ATP-binding protein PotA [Azorhizobium oxalatiphilum]